MTDMPRNEAINYMRQSAEVLDLESLPKTKHIWEDRGLRKVCISPECNRHEAWVKVR